MTGKVNIQREVDLRSIESTADIEIPKDPLARVIGQDEAVALARIAARQRRNLLLVGPPGTGKSMIAQALALHLPKPKEEIRVVHNPENPERPSIEIKKASEVEQERESKESAEGELIEPQAAPQNVAEKLGYRCRNCGTYSSPRERICPKCERNKATEGQSNPFGDIMSGLMESMGSAPVFQGMVGKTKVTTTRTIFGKEEVVVFERAGDKIRMLDQKALEKRRELERLSPRKVLVPLNRNPFVLATGASEAELLGDVRHDPYGGHSNLGTPPFERVVAGAVHEAHEGVLFIDELPHLGNLQRFILTAMQEKAFPITGHNPQSSGASVKVDAVPCDFIFVGACNIQDLEHVLSPLRSRINGNGYEVLVNVAMKDNDLNRAKLAQFLAQEIVMDGRIPHASRGAIEAVIREARKRAKRTDGIEGALSLRLRELGGLIRAAGDIAALEGKGLIDEGDVEKAVKRSMTAEEQIKERYGSYVKGLSTDISQAQKERSQYYFANESADRDDMFH
ncbi:MAG: ATP-binding protein [Methanomassiliicoccales archaeon]|nr:MAG: ATP-binding protein [Methanomassiliicoccales archaeon]